MKKERSIKLFGITENGEIAKTSDSNNVKLFTDDNGTFSIKMQPNAVVITTKKGKYEIEKHATINAYIGVCNNIKVRITLKKIVGTITFWN